MIESYWILGAASLVLAVAIMLRGSWASRGLGFVALLAASGALIFGAQWHLLKIKLEDLWGLLFLFGCLSAYSAASIESYRLRLATAVATVLAVASVEAPEPIVKIVLLQMAFLSHLAAKPCSGETNAGGVLLPVSVAVLSALFQVTGVLFEAMFRLRMDNLALAKVSVAATVVGYALRMGLPPVHLWYRGAVEKDSQLLWVLALGAATLAVANSFLGQSVAWVTMESSMRDILAILGFASAGLGFLSAIAMEGRRQAARLALSLWALPFATLSIPVAHRGALVFAMSFSALVMGWILLSALSHPALSIIAHPMFPSLMGIASIAVLAGLTNLSPGISVLAILVYGLYGSALWRVWGMHQAVKPSKVVFVAAVAIMGGIAFGWLLAGAGGL